VKLHGVFQVEVVLGWLFLFLGWEEAEEKVEVMVNLQQGHQLGNGKEVSL
jgi:hypothetical protein